MSGLRRQSGASMLELLGFFLIVTLIYLGLKLVPLYIQHYIVVDVMEGVAKEVNASSTSTGEIRRLAVKRFDINEVDDFDLKNIELLRKPGATTIEINYYGEATLYPGATLLLDFNSSIPVN